MRIALFTASLLAPFAAAGATAPPAPSLLAPTGPWQVEFADSMCVLSRTYDDRGKYVVLFLKPALSGDDFEITVGRVTDQVNEPSGGRAVLTTAGRPGIGSEYTAYNTPQMRLVRINVDKDKIALADLGDTLAVDAVEEGRFLLGTGGIKKALPALTSCVGGLRQAAR